MNTVLLREKEQGAARGGPNLTGIPAQIKLDFEERSGLSLDDVRVCYDSPKPAQFRALAYTQGNRVYIGPGQERCLGHELGHVIQQKRGLVRADGYRNGMPVNEDPALERQADRIGRMDGESVPMGTAGPMQFEKGNAIARIAALLNLNGLNHDRDNILFKALATKFGGDFYKTGKKGKKKQEDVKNFDSLEYLEGLSEEDLYELEGIILGGALRFEQIYGTIGERVEPKHFAEAFVKHHFASSYEEAWDISRKRNVPVNTVMPVFQQDIFFQNEYLAMDKADLSEQYTTRHEYYFWQFQQENLGLTPPPESLRRGKLILGAAESDKKIYHLEGAVDAKGVVFQDGVSVSESTSRKAAYNLFLSILRVVDNMVTGIGEGVPAGMLQRIAEFFRQAVAYLGDPGYREDQALCAAGQAFLKLLEAMRNAYMDIDNWMGDNGYLTQMEFVGYVDEMKTSVESLSGFYIIRGHETWHGEMISALREFISTCQRACPEGYREMIWDTMLFGGGSE